MNNRESIAEANHLGHSLYERCFKDGKTIDSASRSIVGEYRDLLEGWLSQVSPTGDQLVVPIKEYQLVPAY